MLLRRLSTLTFLFAACFLSAEDDSVADIVPSPGPLEGDVHAFPPVADVGARIKHYLVKLQSGVFGERVQALNELRCLGPLASPAVDMLLDCAEHENDAQLSSLALRALGEIGPAARKAERVLLAIADRADGIPSRRATALEALIRVAPESEPVRRAVPLFARDLQPAVRHAALHAALVLSLPSDKEGTENPALALPYSPARKALIRAARDEADCAIAAPALVAWGEAGVEPLAAALRQGGPVARQWAAAALGHMRAQRARVLPILLAAHTAEKTASVRAAVARALTNVDPHSSETLQRLVEELALAPAAPASNATQTSRKNVQRMNVLAEEDSLVDKIWSNEHSAESLLFDAGTEALPVLRRAMANGSQSASAAVLRILKKHLDEQGRDSKVSPEEVGRALAAGLSADEATALRCCGLLERLGPPGRSASANLDALAHTGRTPQLRRAAKLALLNVLRTPGDAPIRSPLAKLPLSELIGILGHAGERAMRVDAALALELHAPDQTALAALLNALHDDDAPLRRAAAESLGAFGAQAAPAVAVLHEWLASEPKSRAEALRTLLILGEKLSAAREAALPVLLHEPIPEGSARLTMQRMLQADAAGVTRTLNGYLDDTDPEIRAHAIGLLSMLDSIPAGDELLVKLMTSARDNDSSVAAAACDALGRSAFAAQPEVLTLLADEAQHSLFATHRRAAIGAVAQALLTMPVQSENFHQGTEALCAVLSDPDEDLASLSAEGLRRVGGPIRGRLLFLASSGDENLARAAFRAGLLLARESSAAELWPVLQERMRQGASRAERARAALVLCAGANAYEEIQPDVAGMLASADREVSSAAAATLRSIVMLHGSLAAGAQEVLKSLLNHPAPCVREAAALLRQLQSP